MMVLILQVGSVRLGTAKSSAVIDEQGLESRSVCLCALALGGEDSRGSESPEVRGPEGAWGGVCL